VLSSCKFRVAHSATVHCRKVWLARIDYYYYCHVQQLADIGCQHSPSVCCPLCSVALRLVQQCVSGDL
jgi:hypothetical protein